MSEERPDDPAMSRRALLRGRFLGGILSNAAEQIESALPKAGALPAARGGAAPEGAAPAVGDRAASPRHRAFPVLRPPGAVREEQFLEGCTRCGACIAACPHDAITLAPPRFRQAAGTPMIDPRASPCRVCDDLPCVAACQGDGAGRVLRFELPVRLGTAEIQPWNCLAHQQSLGLAACSACVDHCPVPGAIEVVDNRPRIVAEACVGCGVCHHVCPAPQNAVIMLPLAVRPAPPS